jgi:hypothetical protein
MEKEKRELDVPKIILLILEIFALALAASFIFFSINGKDYSSLYNQSIEGETIDSLIIALRLYNLHDIPYTTITPKIQLYIEENQYYISAYYFEIVKGALIITDGETKTKDVTLTIKREEITKIIENPKYIKDSVAAGKTKIEKIEGDFVLFTKGYSEWYKEFGL